jgi:hypothetical protein
MHRYNALGLWASADPHLPQLRTIGARVRIPWLGSFLGRTHTPSIVTANSFLYQTLRFLTGNVRSRWGLRMPAIR